MPYGSKSEVVLYLANSYDGPNFYSKHLLPVLSDTVRQKKSMTPTRPRAARFDSSSHFMDTPKVSGDLEMEVGILTTGVFLAAMFEEIENVNSDSLYTKVFEPRTMDWDSKSANWPLHIGRDLKVDETVNEYQSISRLNATKFTLSVKKGEIAKNTLKLVGGSYDVSNVWGTNSFYDSPSMTWDCASLSLDGSGFGDIEEFELTVDDKLEPKYVWGNGSDSSEFPGPYRIVRTAERTVDVSGTVALKNNDELERFILNTSFSMDLFLSNGTEVQSGYLEGIKIDLFNLRFTDYPTQVANRGEIKVAFKATAEYDAANQCAVRFTHQSNLDDYY